MNVSNYYKLSNTGKVDDQRRKGQTRVVTFLVHGDANMSIGAARGHPDPGNLNRSGGRIRGRSSQCRMPRMEAVHSTYKHRTMGIKNWSVRSISGWITTLAETLLETAYLLVVRQ